MKEWVFCQRKKLLSSYNDSDHCLACETNFEKNKLLLCDSCDGAYHTACLSPALVSIPIGHWFCPSCIKEKAFTRTRSSSDDYEDNPNNSKDANQNMAVKNDHDRFSRAIDILSTESYASVVSSTTAVMY